MLRLLFTFIFFIILLPINLVFFPIRLIWKMLFNHKAGLWISLGSNKKIIETTGNVRIR